MQIPAEITAGARVEWTEPPAVVGGETITSATHSGTYYLRSNAAGAGLTVVGTVAADGSGGWDFLILPADSIGLAAGQWFAELVVSDGADGVFSVGSDQLTVLPSLVYSGTPAAFDGRSEAEVALARVRATIAGIEQGGTRMYMIEGRQRMMIDLPQLYRREAELMRRVSKERANAAGVSDPGLIRGVYRRP